MVVVVVVVVVVVIVVVVVVVVAVVAVIVVILSSSSSVAVAVAVAGLLLSSSCSHTTERMGCQQTCPAKGSNVMLWAIPLSLRVTSKARGYCNIAVMFFWLQP